jgi:hypothetical protein
MFLALSSFKNKFEAVRELLAVGCCFGPHLCFGLISSDGGRLWPNIWLFLLGWATAISTIRAICTYNTELLYL